MTFILTIKTKDGIVLAADSKEVVQGGYLKWEDFATLLQKKGQNEDSVDVCLSPKEIAELIYARSRITGGRIMGIDGAKKIFKVTDTTALLIAGKADPGGKDFAETLLQIQNEIGKLSDPNYDQVAKIAFDTITAAFSTDGDDKFDSEHIFCGYDPVQNKYRTTKFRFADSVARDASGAPLKDSTGNLTMEKVFIKAEYDQILVSGGLTDCIRELSEFNRKNPELSLQQGYVLCRKILDLAVAIENCTETIPAIGGHIYYAVINPSGFYWIGQDNEVLNLLE